MKHFIFLLVLSIFFTSCGNRHSYVVRERFQERPVAYERPYPVETYRSEVYRPETRRPEAYCPEGRQPESYRPETRQREPNRPEARLPDVYRPETRQPEVYRPEARQPEAYRPETCQPEVYRPEKRQEPYHSETRQPEVYRPERRQPEVYRPERRQPEVYRPERQQPEVYRPETRQTEGHRPESRQPEAYRPETRQTEVSRPKVQPIVKANPSHKAKVPVKTKAPLKAKAPVKAEIPVVIPSKPTKKPLLIVLDAGHGGKDTGALSKKNAYEEKSLTLTTVNLIKNQLIELGYDVKLTRHKDMFVSLEDRAEMANKLKAVLFVSMHYNFSPSNSAEGIEVFYYKDEKNPYTKRLIESKKLGENVLANIVKKTKATSRGVKKANFAVIRETKMPAILIEGGFLSNPDERQKILDLNYLRYMAQGVANGIDHYLSGIKD